MPGFGSSAPIAYAPLAALLPIIWLSASPGLARMQAWKACFLGLLLSLLLAGWGMPPALLGKAALGGAIFALLPITWAILAAFFAYNVSLSTRAIEQSKPLLIARGFGSSMEGVAGFETAVAVSAVC